MEELDEDAKKKKKMKKVEGSKNSARLHRSLLHFSRAFKKLHGHGRASANSKPSPASSSSTTTAAASSLLSACMHPRTHSFSGGRQHHVAARHRDDDEDDALAVNFRSLRIGPTTDVLDDDEDGSSMQEDYGDRSESEGDDDVAAAAAAKAVADGSGGVAVVTLSVAPYEDFRRSMREMVDDAHARREVVSAAPGARAAAPAVDWDFMEELLFCYLQLNDRAVHKDILRAFTDTVAALRRRRRAPARRPRSRRTRCRLGRAARADGVDDEVEEAVASS